MHLTGWHRLYIVAVLVWAGVVALLFAPSFFDAPSEFRGDLMRTGALVWGVTSVAALMLGYGVAWAVRGFKVRTP